MIMSNRRTASIEHYWALLPNSTTLQDVDAGVSGLANFASADSRIHKTRGSSVGTLHKTRVPLGGCKITVLY